MCACKHPTQFGSVARFLLAFPPVFLSLGFYLKLSSSFKHEVLTSVSSWTPRISTDMSLRPVVSSPAYKLVTPKSLSPGYDLYHRQDAHVIKKPEKNIAKKVENPTTLHTQILGLHLLPCDLGQVINSLWASGSSLAK